MPPACSPSVPRSPLHIAWAIWSVSSSISKRSPSGGNGKPRPRDSYSFQAAPIPSHARPPDRMSSVVVAFTQSAGVPVVDAADHQAEARARRVRGHEAEGGHALEHRLLDRADAPDLEEMVHDPDRVEADVVGLADDAGEGRADASAVPPGHVNEEIWRPSFIRGA